MNKKSLDKEFWDQRYKEGNTGWDIGGASTPLMSYAEQLENKSIKVLIPGCGNAYEAEKLIEMGFENITLIDISPTLCEALQKRIGNRAQIICGDFFELDQNFDLILEQTFYCALHPSQREDYINKMHELLNDKGKLVGVLFNTEFDREGPPFGGDIQEYQNELDKKFDIQTLEECENSIEPRQGKELFFIAQKKAT